MRMSFFFAQNDKGELVRQHQTNIILSHEPTQRDLPYGSTTRQLHSLASPAAQSSLYRQVTHPSSSVPSLSPQSSVTDNISRRRASMLREVSPILGGVWWAAYLRLPAHARVSGGRSPGAILRASRFELHPENAGSPYEILLGQLGKERLKSEGRVVPQPDRSPAADGQVIFPERATRWAVRSWSTGSRTAASFSSATLSAPDEGAGKRPARAIFRAGTL